VQALRLSGVDKSKVSRIGKELDELVGDFRQRPLAEAYPYVWLDALFLKVRQHRRVVSQAVVIAVGVNRQGERSVLKRGLRGAKLVISDAPAGLKAVVGTVVTLSSLPLYRCRALTALTRWTTRSARRWTISWWKAVATSGSAARSCSSACVERQ
jgi:transposase-like protein